MQAKELNQLLINSFPELETKFHEEVDWQESRRMQGIEIILGVLSGSQMRE